MEPLQFSNRELLTLSITSNKRSNCSIVNLPRQISTDWLKTLPCLWYCTPCLHSNCFCGCLYWESIDTTVEHNFHISYNHLCSLSVFVWIMLNVIFRMSLATLLFIMLDIGPIWIMELNKADRTTGRMSDISNDTQVNTNIT